MCDEKDIKELIPAYREQGLDKHDQERVRIHLESCDDCRADLALLRLMQEESVPDPGERYWDEMPGRIFRAVQERKERKWSFRLPWLTDRFLMPRWVLAASTVGLALAIGWFAVQTHQTQQKGPSMTESQGYETVPEIMVSDAVPLSDLDRDQLDTIAAWAGSELASIARETSAAPVMVNTTDADIDEELTDLDTKAAERLSTMLNQWKQEG
jgi:Putative zinc-finger